MRQRRPATALLTLLLAGMALASTAACSASAEFHVGTPKVRPDQLEKQVSDLLEKQVGQRPDGMDCPHALEGKVGASTRCVLTAGTDKLGVTVTVTAVKGTNIKYEAEVDKTPMG